MSSSSSPSPLIFRGVAVGQDAAARMTDTPLAQRRHLGRPPAFTGATLCTRTAPTMMTEALLLLLLPAAHHPPPLPMHCSPSTRPGRQRPGAYRDSATPHYTMILLPLSLSSCSPTVSVSPPPCNKDTLYDNALAAVERAGDCRHPETPLIGVSRRKSTTTFAAPRFHPFVILSFIASILLFASLRGDI